MFTQTAWWIFRAALVLLLLLAIGNSSAQIAAGDELTAASNRAGPADQGVEPVRRGLAAFRAFTTAGDAVFGVEEKSRRIRKLFDREVQPMATAVYQHAILPAEAAKVIEEQVKPAVGVVKGVVNPASVNVPANVMYVRFSKSFLRSYFNKRFEKNLPVSDTILGAAVRGTSRTLADTELELIENPKEAQAKLFFKGTTSFNTTSYSGPIQVHSRGFTRFTSQKKVWFDSLNVAQSKATTTAKTETTSTNITTSLPRLRGRISLNIAEEEVASKRALAQQITTERTKQRIEQAFEKVAQERAAAFTQELREQYAKLPFEGRFALSEIQCSTTPNSLQIVVIGQGENKPTFVDAPARLKDQPDIEVHIHSALLQKIVVSAELRKTLQLAVISMVDRPLMSLVNATAKPAAKPAPKQPEREMELHWTEGEDLPWLSLAWYEKEPEHEKATVAKQSDQATKAAHIERK